MSTIQDSDYFLINRGGTDYKISLSDVKDFYDRNSSITITEPAPVGPNVFFENNESIIEWKNKDKPVTGTSTRTFFYAEGSSVKEYLLFDDTSKQLVATTTSPYNIPRVNETDTDIHKYGTYPQNVLVKPTTQPQSVGVAHSIGAHQFSDGEWVYILTGNGTWYWSKDMMEWPESQRATRRKS